MKSLDMSLHTSKTLQDCEGPIDGYNKELDSPASETEHDGL